MCGIAGMFGPGYEASRLAAMLDAQRHRGPDHSGCWSDPRGRTGLAQNRLSIIDLSAAGHQPMWNHDRTCAIVFNGEIYNYLELRAELAGYRYASQTDTEVVLAAYERWGEDCLDRFRGMFAFLLWDIRQQRLFAARDRFGVKPLNYHLRADGTLLAASEIKALHRAGVPAVPDPVVWSTYLTRGLLEYSPRTFWTGIQALSPGHKLIWQNGTVHVSCWYDLAQRTGDEFDDRPVRVVEEEYLGLLEESVRLRFRSDVPVGINLSGGLDSSTLLGLVQAVQGPDSEVRAYTFVTGDPAYDETPWVRQMLAHTRHPSSLCVLQASEVPELAASVAAFEDEPFGGVPTLAYARLFEQARAEGTVVLLDGQGMDEQWAGYDYYAHTADAGRASVVQGTGSSPVRPACLTVGFRELAEPFAPARPFSDALRNLQYRDIRHSKIPRALRFNDRASMRSSTELREPFLDHRLFELAVRQPAERKINGSVQKWMLRSIASALLPGGVVEAPKRALQTPQREWLRGPLRSWAGEMIDVALEGSDWLDAERVRTEWTAYCRGSGDNSFYVWQWIGLGLLRENSTRPAAASARGTLGAAFV